MAITPEMGHTGPPAMRAAMLPGQHEQRQEDTARPVVLQLQGLTKRFGTLTAVDSLDLEVRQGEVVGLLGPNGAGKSTTIGMVLGLIAPSAGRITILGQDAARRRGAPQRTMGAIIEQPAFYPYLSGRDNLRALALATGGVSAQRIESLLALVDLTERAASPFRTYSLGMKERLGLASTLLTDPALVILDEPTNGLDPAGQRDVRHLIPRLAREGRGVLLASHLLHEVEQVCDRVVIVRRGKLVAAGPVATLLRAESYLDVVVDQPQRAAALLRRVPSVAGVTDEGTHLRVAIAPECGADLSRALAEEGLYARAIVPCTSSLEDLFLELTEADNTASVERTARHVASVTK